MNLLLISSYLMLNKKDKVCIQFCCIVMACLWLWIHTNECLIYIFWVQPVLLTSGNLGALSNWLVLSSAWALCVGVWWRQIHFMWPSLHITWTCTDDVKFTSRQVNVTKTGENWREMMWGSSMGKPRAQFRQKATTTTFQRNEVVSATLYTFIPY